MSFENFRKLVQRKLSQTKQSGKAENNILTNNNTVLKAQQQTGTNVKKGCCGKRPHR